MEISVRLRRESGHYTITFAASKVRLDNFFKKVKVSVLSVFFINLFHLFFLIANNLANINIIPYFCVSYFDFIYPNYIKLAL